MNIRAIAGLVSVATLATGVATSAGAFSLENNQLYSARPYLATPLTGPVVITVDPDPAPARPVEKPVANPPKLAPQRSTAAKPVVALAAAAVPPAQVVPVKPPPLESVVVQEPVPTILPAFVPESPVLLPATEPQWPTFTMPSWFTDVTQFQPIDMAPFRPIDAAPTTSKDQRFQPTDRWRRGKLTGTPRLSEPPHKRPVHVAPAPKRIHRSPCPWLHAIPVPSEIEPAGHPKRSADEPRKPRVTR